MGNRNTTHTQEASRTYLQGKHHSVAVYTDIMPLTIQSGSVWIYCLLDLLIFFIISMVSFFLLSEMSLDGFI